MLPGLFCVRGMEAYLHGAVSDEQVPRLKSLLEGLSAGPGEHVEELHVVMAAAPTEEGGVPSEVLLCRDAHAGAPTGGPAAWRVRLASRPLAGERASKLGAAVRDVSHGVATSGDAFKLHASAGYKIQYQLMRTGLRFALLEPCGRVVVVSLLRLSVRDPNALPKGVGLLEATCATSADDYSAACAALDAVRVRLAPCGQLVKPATHLVRPGEAAALVAPTKPVLGLRT